MFKGSLLLLPDSCMTPLSAKLYALTHLPSLSANQGRLWTFDLDKSWLRGRYNCVRDIRRSHGWPFCALVSAQLEYVHACTLLIKRNCLVKTFCLSCVCFWHRRVFNSNNWEPKDSTLGSGQNYPATTVVTRTKNLLGRASRLALETLFATPVQRGLPRPTWENKPTPQICSPRFLVGGDISSWEHGDSIAREWYWQVPNQKE
jgi:hypothetical protein